MQGPEEGEGTRAEGGASEAENDLGERGGGEGADGVIGEGVACAEDKLFGGAEGGCYGW